MFSDVKSSLALFSVCLAALMFGLEISSVPVILPTLESTLGASIRDMQGIMASCTIGCAVVLNVSGSLADRYGRRFILCLSVGAFGITSLACGLSTSPLSLIIARLNQGIAGGAMLTCVVATLNSQFPDGAKRSQAFGTWGTVFGAGLGFGPIVGGLLLEFSNWRWTFLIHTVIALPTLFLLKKSVRETKGVSSRSLDIVGMSLLASAIFIILYYVVEGPSLGRPKFTSIFSVFSVFSVFSSAVFLSTFYYRQKHIENPTIDFSLFKVPAFSGEILGAIGMNFSFWPFIIYLPLYLKLGLGLPSLDASLLLLSYTLPAILSPPLGEYLALRWQARIIIPLGLLISGLGFSLLLVGEIFSLQITFSLLPGSILSGFGVGLINTLITNTSTQSVNPHQAGMASEIDTSANLITLSIIISLMGALLVGGIGRHLAQDSPSHENGLGIHSAAEALAAGNIDNALEQIPELTAAGAREAFTAGFLCLTAFAFVSLLLFSVLSFVTFRIRSRDVTSKGIGRE